MIKLSVDVTMSDGSAGSYPVSPRVQVDFEREYKCSIVGAFAEEPKLEHLYWLGWRSMKAAGVEVGPFDGWLDRVESVMPAGVDDVPLAPPPS